MGDSLRYKDWFEKAAHDLRGAEILMEHDGGNDLVAFHCQQTMEKMLKGWLLKTTGELLFILVSRAMNNVCIFIIIGLCCYLHDSIFAF